MADKEPDEHEADNGEEGSTATKSKHDRANAADLEKV